MDADFLLAVSTLTPFAFNRRQSGTNGRVGVGNPSHKREKRGIATRGGSYRKNKNGYNSSNQYGQGEGAPRGCAGDGTHLYVIGNNRKRLIGVKNLETFASEYASATITGTALHRINAPLTGSSTHAALTGTLPSNIFSLASDGTHLYGYRQSDNTIHRITVSGQTITAASYATVTFPADVSTNIRSFSITRVRSISRTFPRTGSTSPLKTSHRVARHPRHGY